jgi:hypothetical protein
MRKRELSTGRIMLKALWKKWTIDRPAMLGDWLWDAFVIQLAAFLERLTPRKIIALIPLGVLFVAYYHSVPLPPEVMILGDVLAYIDIFTVLLLLRVLSRLATILFIMRQMTARFGHLARAVMRKARRFQFRHRREPHARGRKRLAGRSENDDELVIVGGVAWA